MTLGERLRKEREKRGWTQLYVAKKLGIPNQNLSNYERDFRSPDAENLIALADLYEVTTDYLLGRSTDPQLSKHEEDMQSEESLKSMREKIEKGLITKDDGTALSQQDIDHLIRTIDLLLLQYSKQK